ncbi:MAG: MarR family winged helix-turn-helix transcriptional regulator [bacterium]
MLNQYEQLLHKYRNRFFEERLGGTGLAGSSGFYLMKIVQSGPVKMNNIVEDAPFHKSQATRAITRLNHCRLVEKTVDGADQRGYILEATTAGCQACTVVASAVEDWDKLLASALNSEEIALLNALTQKMYMHVKNYFEEEKRR